MNWWNDIGTAEFNDKGNPFTEGNYVLSIESIRTKKGWEGGSFLIVSFRVVQADNGVQPGTPRDAVFSLEGKNARMSLGEIKGFVFDLFGINRNDRSQDAAVTELCSRMTNVNNPFMGAMIAAEARNIQVNPSKRYPSGIFCKPRYIHYPGNPKTAADILATPPAPQLPMAQAGYGNQPPAQQGYAPAAQRPPVPPTGQAWGAPPPALPPPPPAGKVRPPNLPASYVRADGAWWDGTGWNL
jgi:hypothetical protein